MSHRYPLLLDVTDRLIVIIGGGGVAARKCEGLIAAGATRIRVVSPVFSDHLPAAVERIAAKYESKHLDGAQLVFAATDSPSVNDAIVAEAHRRGLLVCRADGSDDSPGDFITPAAHRDGAVTVTVSAGGSPVLAARIRDELAGHVRADLVQLAGALQQLRPAMLADAKLAEPQRRELFRKLASDEAAAVLQSGGPSALEQWIATAIAASAKKLGAGQSTINPSHSTTQRQCLKSPQSANCSWCSPRRSHSLSAGLRRSPD